MFLNSFKMAKKIKAPVRIDFAGGTTDISPFKDTHGGATLNAAINKYIYGRLRATSRSVSLEYHGDIPTSSGLGTSGVMNLVWLALISQDTNFNSSAKKNNEKITKKLRAKLAEQVYKIEQAQNLVGGKQDQYASAFGGINLWEFKKQKVIRTPVKLSRDTRKELEDNLVLLYIGKHFSGDSNKFMVENLTKSHEKIKHLNAIKHLAYDMKTSLEYGYFNLFSNLMNQYTIHRRKLHNSIIPSKVESIIKKARKNGAKGVKVCGSGNGGSLLVYGDKSRIKRCFSRNKDIKVIDFKFDWNGLSFY